MRRGPRRAAVPGRRAAALRLGPVGRPHACRGRRRDHGRGRRHRRLRRASTSRCSPPATTVARAGAEGRGRRRHRHRQLVGLAHGPRRPARRCRGQRRTPRPIPKGIVANPNCTTMVGHAGAQAARPRGRPARRSSSAPTRRCRAAGWPAWPSSTSRSARWSTGAAELTLRRRGRRVPDAAGVRASRSRSTCIPLAGIVVDDGSDETDEEQKLRNESRKILGIPDLPCRARACGCPVFTGHSLSINARFARPDHAGRGAGVLAGAPGVELADVPTPLEAAGIDPTFVGPHPGRPDRRATGLALFVLERQPAQGRRAQRGPDRRGARRGPTPATLAAQSVAARRATARSTGASAARSGRPRRRATGRAGRPATPARPARRPARGAAARGVPLRTAWASSPTSSASHATVAAIAAGPVVLAVGAGHQLLEHGDLHDAGG